MQQAPSVASEFGLDIWSQISKHCDRNTIRLLCSHQIHSVIRESALPYLFKDLGVTISPFERPEDDRLELTPEAFSKVIPGRSRQRHIRLILLSKSRYVPFVRTWQFKVNMDQARMTKLDRERLWPAFATLLVKYTQLESLFLKNVPIHDGAVISTNTLPSLKILSLDRVQIHTEINLGSPHLFLTKLVYIPAARFSSQFIIGVCATLRILEVEVERKDYRAFYDVLECCPVLDQLSVDHSYWTEGLVQCPGDLDALAVAACPNLSQYCGPGLYTEIIKTRPVRVIRINYFFELQVSALPPLYGGAVPVEEVEIVGWPTYLIQEIFKNVTKQYPDLMVLDVTFFQYEFLFHGQDKELYRKLHYLQVVHDISTGEYTVPQTIHTLRFVANSDYYRRANITLDQVMDRIKSSEMFSNLDCVTLGHKNYFRFWHKSETGDWSMTQHGDYDPDGGGGSDYDSDFFDRMTNDSEGTDEEEDDMDEEEDGTDDDDGMDEEEVEQMVEAVNDNIEEDV